MSGKSLLCGWSEESSDLTLLLEREVDRRQTDMQKLVGHVKFGYHSTCKK